LYEDKDIAICVKPPEILSQSPGMPEKLSALLGGEFFCVHRLDKGVGGVMVYARNAAAAAKLSQMTAGRELEKYYLALIPDVLDSDEGIMEDLLFRDKEKNKSFVVKRMRKGVKDAKLEFRRLAAVGGTALLKIRLHTGRSHQIRCQLSSRGAPILGDSKYGSGLKCGGIAPWSYKLAFSHPKNGKRMEFSHEPEGQVWDELRQYCLKIGRWGQFLF